MNRSYLILISLLHFGTLLYGQYSGPETEIPIYRIKEVRNKAFILDRNDSTISIEGYITLKIDHEHYRLEDGESHIQVEIDKKLFGDRVITENDLVRLTGEVDYDLLGGSELEVESIEIINVK